MSKAPKLFPQMTEEQRKEFSDCHAAIIRSMKLMHAAGISQEVTVCAALAATFDLACHGLPFEGHACVEHAVSMSALEVAHTRSHIRQHWGRSRG